MTRNQRAVVLALFASTLACRERDEPPMPPATGPWRTLMNNGRALVSLDTATIEKLPAGRARVHLRYAFDAPIATGPGTNGQAPIRIFVLESIEETQCEAETARAVSATLFDSAGRTIGAAGNQQGASPPSMIGDAGPALCAYLRRAGVIAPDA